MITVREVISLALPEGTQVLAGEAGLGREVTWATRLRPSPPAFGHLSGGELVLLPAALLEFLDEQLTLEEAIRQLVAFGVAAVAHVGPVTEESRNLAEAAGVPLLQLPVGSELGPLEREASRLITERRRAVQRRGQDVGRRLMELAIAGEPLSTMVRSLAELARRPVALEGRDGRLLAYHVADAAGPLAATIEPLLQSDSSVLTPWLYASAAGSPADPPTATRALDGTWSRVVAPVIRRDGLLGSLSLIVRRGVETPEDALLTSRGSAACSVALARDHAAASARREVELNVLDEVLDGALRSEVSLLQQARRLGHDLTAPHVAFVARFDHNAGSPARHRDERWVALDDLLARHNREALWRVRNNSAEIVWPAASAVDANRTARAIVDDLASRTVGRNGSSATISLGIGRPKEGVAGIRQSYQEARHALTMGRRLRGPGHLTSFDDLGVHRLIFAAEGLPELRTFHDETLDTLLAYDRQHGADLLRTLEAFFAARCSPKEAAERLSVHRNTVLYRLDRIREITALDLDDADVRLRLHLALQVHMALYSGES